MTRQRIELVSHTTRPSPSGRAPYHVLIITPDKHFPLWMLQRAVSESILVEQDEVVEYSATSDGNLRLVVKSIKRTRRLLKESWQLPDIYRCLPAD